jgi:hypothetical protein
LVDERICLHSSINGDAIMKIDYEERHVVGDGEADRALSGGHWPSIAEAHEVGTDGGYIEPLAIKFELDRDVGRIVGE